MNGTQDALDLVLCLRMGRIDRHEFVRRMALLGLAPAAISALLAAPDGAAATSGSGSIPGPPWQGGTPGGTATVASNDASANFDPATSYDIAGYYGAINHLRGLLFFGGAPLTPQLDIAEAMDINSNATRYLFKIRKGVQFHNGREVTAADFKWTLERTSSRQLASWIGATFGNVTGYTAFYNGKAAAMAGIKVIDRYTLVLDLDRPDVTIPVSLASPPYFVVPKEDVQRLGKGWSSHPVGCGPYQVASVNLGSSQLVATKFAHYYDAPRLPYIDTLTWQWNVSQQLQELRVLRGAIDSAENGPPLADVPRLAGSGQSMGQLEEWNTLDLQWVEFNVTMKPFTDKRVRQAVNYAVNRERLRAAGLKPTGRLIPPNLFGYKKDLRVYTYDPERARALLKAAGYGSGLTLTWPIFPNDRPGEQRALLMGQDLKAIGINITFKRVSGGVYDLGAKLRGMFPLWHMGWGMGRPDPSELVLSLVGTGAASNYGGYSNPVVDRLGQQGQAELDPAKRAQIYSEMEQVLLDDAAWLFLGTSRRFTFHTKRLKNMNWNAPYFQLYDRMWLAR